MTANIEITLGTGAAAIAYLSDMLATKVGVTAQTFTPAQKSQARQNMGLDIIAINTASGFAEYRGYNGEALTFLDGSATLSSGVDGDVTIGAEGVALLTGGSATVHGFSALTLQTGGVGLLVAPQLRISSNQFNLAQTDTGVNLLSYDPNVLIMRRPDGATVLSVTNSETSINNGAFLATRTRVSINGNGVLMLNAKGKAAETISYGLAVDSTGNTIKLTAAQFKTFLGI